MQTNSKQFDQRFIVNHQKMDKNPDILRGRYKLIKEISRGGMGVVYLAKDLLKNREVAVKKSFFSGAKQAEQAFEIEAKLLARLKHPGLPRVLDYFFSENNVQTLVMDFIVGETLEDVLESGKFRVGRGLDSIKVVNWALQILDILRYLHNFEPPVVHRDIKPNNIKLTVEGKIILLDFGLAKGSAVTVVGGMSGYSPIEQVQRSGTDPRSDIYALGTTLFHLLTDQHPDTALNRFREIYGQSLMINLGNDGAISPNPDPQKTAAEINPQVPSIISEIITKATALMPNDRFQSAEEMKSALLKAKRKLDALTTRRVTGDLGIQTNLDMFNDWEKAKPLFDEDEESLGHWKPQKNDEDLNNEKMDSLASFVPQEIGDSEVDFDNEPTKTEKDAPSATVSSTSLFGKKASEITKPSVAIKLSPTVLSLEEPIPTEFPIFESNNPPRKISKRIIPLVIGGIALILLVSLGVLAWYLIIPTSPKTNLNEAKTIAEIPVSPQETKISKQIEISNYRAEKDGKETLLPENYLFQNNEKFFFNLASPTSGFLYVISRNSQDKVVMLCPASDKQKNAVTENKETRFPAKFLGPLYFDKESPETSWIYFLVVPNQEHELVKKIKNTLVALKEENLSKPEVASLVKELDEIAESLAKNEIEAKTENNVLVRVLKTQKKP